MTGIRSTILAAAAVVAGLAVAPALADGDAKKGEKVFRKCKTCHEISETKNKIGPNLVGIIGRAAGSVEGFAYSDAMKNSGITWNAETIAAYVADPKGYLPGNKMVFVGIKKTGDVEDLLAFLTAE
jgi:cytochrome c2